MPIEATGKPLGKTERAIWDLIQEVRLFLRDFKELNRLISGEESSNRMIAWALQDAVDDWNSTPPLIGAVGVLSHPSRSLLVRCTVITLLQSVGFLQTRNHLTYSDGSGASVNVSDKTPVLQAWINLLSAGYEQKKIRLKTGLNIEGAWGGGVHSELNLVNAFYTFGN